MVKKLNKNIIMDILQDKDSPMIYSEENIYISGGLYEEDETPITLIGKELRFDFTKGQTNIAFSIMDVDITKEDNTYSFIIGTDITSKYNGTFNMQVSIIENGDAVKSVALNAITINKSKNVLNG